MQSENCRLLASCILVFAALAPAMGQTPEVSLSNQVTLDAPPLPELSRPRDANPSATRPKAALPGRGEPQESAIWPRTLPLPGQPARNLPEIGQTPPAEEDMPSLIQILPHRGPTGALLIEYIYTGETFNLARGGMSGRTPTNYRGNLDVVMTLDTEVAQWWDGGRFFVYGQSLHGQPLSASDVGDIQLFSNIDSTISDTERPQFTAIAEYWYEHLSLDGRLRCKIGKQDANADFAYSDVAGDFINSSFGLPPTIPLPTFPSQALGIANFFALTEALTFGFGIYDGTSASGPQGVRWGFDTLGHGGAIMLGQFELRSQSGINDQLPGTVRVGMWEHTGHDQWTDFSPQANALDNNGGGWLTGDKMLWKEQYGDDDTQGLAAFAMYSWTRADRSVMRSSLAGGFVYKGILPNREEDLLGIGTAVANFGDPYRIDSERAGTVVGNREIATELFYKCQVTDATILQPELQYITAPSGIFEDALLVGLRFEAAL